MTQKGLAESRDIFLGVRLEEYGVGRNNWSSRKPSRNGAAWRVRAEVAEVLALREARYDRKKGKKAAPLRSEEGRFEGCVGRRNPRGSSATLLPYPTLPYQAIPYHAIPPTPTGSVPCSSTEIRKMSSSFGNMLHGCTSIVLNHPRVRPSLVHDGQNFRQPVYRRRRSPETSILTLGIRRDSAHSQPKFWPSLVRQRRKATRYWWLASSRLEQQSQGERKKERKKESNCQSSEEKKNLQDLRRSLFYVRSCWHRAGNPSHDIYAYIQGVMYTGTSGTTSVIPHEKLNRKHKIKFSHTKLSSREKWLWRFIEYACTWSRFNSTNFIIISTNICKHSQCSYARAMSTFRQFFFFFFFSLKIVESDVHVVARVTVLFPLNFYEHLLTIIFFF